MKTCSDLLPEKNGSIRQLLFRAGLQLVSLAGLLGLTSGCVSSVATLKPEAVAKVQQTIVRSYFPQNELKGEFVQSGYGAGGGLIGAIVDASVNSGRANASERRVQPIRDLVRDLDLRTAYWLALSNAVCPVVWLKVERFETHPAEVQPVTRALAAEGAVLNMGSSYHLSQDCRVLVFKTGFDFYLPGKRRATAMSLAIYNSKEIGTPDGDKAIPLWTTNGAAAFRQTAEEAVRENVKLVAHAIEVMGGTAAVPPRRAKLRAKLIHVRGDFGITSGQVSVKAFVWEETPDRLLLQLDAGGWGQFYSLPHSEVEVEYLP
jgi:hypothetical protein